MTAVERSTYVRRARTLGVALIGVAAAPTILGGDMLGALIVAVVGIAVFYAGAYAGAVGMAPLE